MKPDRGFKRGEIGADGLQVLRAESVVDLRKDPGGGVVDAGEIVQELVELAFGAGG